MPTEKLTPSFTFTEDRLHALQAVVPEIFADGQVNWDTLREALAPYLEDEGPGTEHFGLFWPGKRQARRLAAQPSKGTLRPVPGQGINEDTTRNLFIEGDNLEVLKLLQKSYAGRVKLIYIDPPYNTGNDFVYKDDFREPLEDYLKRTSQADAEGLLTTNPKAGGRFHSNWLNMMLPRLMLARTLLTEDGVIFVSIDDNELNNLRQMMDEIFGGESFIGCVANINNPKGRSDDKYIATAHEYLIIYKKSNLTLFKGWEPGENITRRYNKIDKEGNRYREIDLRKTRDNDRREHRPNMFYYFYYNKKNNNLYASYEVKIPEDYVKIIPLREDGVHGRWRWGIENANKNIEKLVAKLMPRRQIWSVFEMDYLSEDEMIKPTSAWNQKEVNSERGSEQFIDLGFKKEDFPRPKPLGLIKLILQLSTRKLQSDIFLDFFSGSSTTAHAILELNREDGGNRRFIMVQMPEPTPPDSAARQAGYKTIADIGKERIRRVIAKQQKQPVLDRDPPEDLGFAVYRLDRSHFKAWQDYDGPPNPAAIDDLFSRFEDPLTPGWQPRALLDEVLLLQGFPLDSRRTRLKDYSSNVLVRIDCDWFSYRLFVCLDSALHPATLDQLPLNPDDKFICLDSALTDQTKQQLTDRCTLVVI